MFKPVQKIKRKIKTKIKLAVKRYKIIIKGIDNRDSLFDFLTYFQKCLKKMLNRFLHSKYKILYILRNLLSSRFIYILLSILLMSKMIFFYNEIEMTKESFNALYELSLIFILVTLCPLWFVRKNKNRFYIGMIFNIIISLVLFADCVYWKFAVNMLSVSQILYVKYAEEITNSIFFYLDETQWLFFIDIPILFVLWIISRLPLIKDRTKIRKNKGKRNFIPALVCLWVLIGYTFEPISVSFKEMSENPYLKFSQVGMGSILGYHYLDISNAFNMRETTKYRTYDSMMTAYSVLDEYSVKNTKIDDNFNGIAKGKNVIILQLESLQNFVIGREINGKEITPNLNKFLNENIEITNMISQSYSTTADSEYSVMTSLYPLENGQAFSMYNSNINNDIYNLYNNAGYHTYYMHGNVMEFWSRVNVYERLGIDEISYIYGFPDTSETIGGYLSDELLYRQAVQKLLTYGRPFMTSIVAASSHTPFDLDGIKDKDKKVNIDVGKYKDTQFGSYLEAVNYADYAFGIFIDELKANDLYDDTVMIIFGDHYGLNIDNEEMEEFIKETNINYNDISRCLNYVNVVCGMKIPEVEALKIEVPVSKVDIKPSLLQISGIDDDFSLGKTMFSTKDYAYISIGSIVTKDYYYTNDEWYEIDTGNVVNLGELQQDEKIKLEELVKNMKLQLDISNSIIINNLLKRH